jgi:uncharacterized protein (DUF58 family)
MSTNDWQVAGRRHGQDKFTWNAVLWALIYPQRSQRIQVTVSGLLLIVLAMGIGMAAYNAANNILFITLSLLLACLVLSGVLSASNFRRVAWRLQVAPPLRVGQEAVMTLELKNGKRFLPTYGLWFDLLTRPVDTRPAAKVETTFTASGVDIRAALERAEQLNTRSKIFLRSRLDPKSEVRLESTFRPKQRGRISVELENVGSLFPFGFLNKSITAGLRVQAVVWPAPVEYRRFATQASRRPTGGERMMRVGSGSDLLGLRHYERGDSHGLIHWKASARLGKLLVRQLAAESLERFAFWLRTDAEIWSRPEQFELMISFAATLLEDLFRADKLSSVAVDFEAATPIRRVRDLEAVLDVIAELQPRTTKAGIERFASGQRTNLVTLSPEGPRGVVAWVQGQRIAAA